MMARDDNAASSEKANSADDLSAQTRRVGAGDRKELTQHHNGRSANANNNMCTQSCSVLPLAALISNHSTARSCEQKTKENRNY